LQFGDDQISGAAIAGLPGVLLGRNKNVAWGVTAANVDNSDAYLEYIDPSET